jgi:hypothetical protein
MFTKVVLGIFIRPATVSDGMAWTLDTTVATLLAKSFYLLGDAAFIQLQEWSQLLQYSYLEYMPPIVDSSASHGPADLFFFTNASGVFEFLLP